jgi:hypothetical protein
MMALTYKAKRLGNESITLKVQINGAEVQESISFEVIDCVYHASMEAGLSFKGGTPFKVLTVDVKWNEGGGFTLTDPVGTIVGSGRGEVVETFNGAVTNQGVTETCVPTSRSANTSDERHGFLSLLGVLHLQFVFAPFNIENTPVKCTVNGQLAPLPPTHSTESLNTLSIAKERAYPDETGTYPFKFYTGKGTLTITKADPKAVKP